MFVILLKGNSSGIRYTIYHNTHIIASVLNHEHVRIKYLLDTDFSLAHTYYIHVV
jgi:hypothetical protein